MLGQRFALYCAVVLAALAGASVDAQQLRGLQAYPSTAAFSKQMLEAVNAERAKQGLSPLCYNKKVNAAAQAHSDDQARSKKMSHTGSNGSTLGQRVTAQGFKWNNVGENVAAGQRDVAAVMQAWMNSSGHRANILGKDFKFFGMGYATGGSTPYWTQKFANGAGEVCDNGSPSDSDAKPSPAPVPAPQPGYKPSPAPVPAPQPAPQPGYKPSPAPVPAPQPGYKPSSAPVPRPTAAPPSSAPAPKPTSRCGAKY
ncbi:hypothetical protein P43SY_001296 [Pythium insidiosum]|uniref:SCP domain-containing protein n=1 Tax=Pythium insidiosum TaxID=114742 RepID=A0AAD5Q798_PYTIN|nr:hypothetical protein P43SY_001296 [Pythium insidiosum]